jgi:hypothetical protein
MAENRRSRTAPTITQTKLLFLTVNPQEKDRRKLELQNAEALSHAARRSHQIRRQSADKLPSRRKGQARPRKRQLPVEGDEIPASLAHPLSSVSPDDRDKGAEALWELSQRLQGQGPGPNNVLDASFRDPFNAFGAKGLPKYVFEMLDFAIRVVWPKSCPSKADGATAIVKSYVQVVMESPTALHVAVSVQLGQVPMFQTTAENRKTVALERMKHKNLAYDKIHAEIRDLEQEPNKTPSEGILYAVGLLALYGTTSNKTLQDDHPMSPLATAQSLNVYGRMELVEEHIRGMHLLVRRKGGVDNIKEISNQHVVKWSVLQIHPLSRLQLMCITVLIWSGHHGWAPRQV